MWATVCFVCYIFGEIWNRDSRRPVIKNVSWKIIVDVLLYSRAKLVAQLMYSTMQRIRNISFCLFKNAKSTFRMEIRLECIANYVNKRSLYVQRQYLDLGTYAIIVRQTTRTVLQIRLFYHYHYDAMRQRAAWAHGVPKASTSRAATHTRCIGRDIVATTCHIRLVISFYT